MTNLDLASNGHEKWTTSTFSIPRKKNTCKKKSHTLPNLNHIATTKRTLNANPPSLGSVRAPHSRCVCGDCGVSPNPLVVVDCAPQFDPMTLPRRCT